MCLFPPRSAVAAGVAAVLAIGLVNSSTQAQQLTVGKPSPGKVSFDLPDLPPATVEIDLGQGLIRHVLGLGDAAVSGVIEGLAETTDARTAENMNFVAQQLTSAKELSDLVGEVIQEVHVRVWDRLPDGSQAADKASRHLNQQLKSRGWEATVRVRDGDDMVNVFVRREGESLRGAFIIAADGNDMVLANLIGDLSADNVHRLTSAATKIAVKLGLDKELNRAVEKLKHERNR